MWPDELIKMSVKFTIILLTYLMFNTEGFVDKLVNKTVNENQGTTRTKQEIHERMNEQMKR